MEDVQIRKWKRPVTRAKPGNISPLRMAEYLRGGDDGFQAHPGRKLTEREFLDWVREKTRVEWVDGEVSFMSPVSVEHDSLQGWLAHLFRSFVEARDLGEIRGSKLFVRLPGKKRFRLTDLFYAHPSKNHLFVKGRFEGAPDLVVEIVSADDPSRDYRDKFSDYMNAGVKEYWIIDPRSEHIEVHEWVKGTFKPIAVKDGAFHSKVLKGLWIRGEWLWSTPRPKVVTVLREMGIKST